MVKRQQGQLPKGKNWVAKGKPAQSQYYPQPKISTIRLDVAQ